MAVTMTTTMTTMMMMKPRSDRSCGMAVLCVRVRDAVGGAWLGRFLGIDGHFLHACVMMSRGGGVDDAAFADGGGGWRRRVTMVVVVMAPGLCWDNELGGRSLVMRLYRLPLSTTTTTC